MKLYHPDATEPVEAHPSQVENMKAIGWTEEQPKQKKNTAQSADKKKEAK